MIKKNNGTTRKISLLNVIHVKTFAILSYFILIVLIGMSIYIALQVIQLAQADIPFDLTPLMVAWVSLVIGDITECGAVTGLYIWKAKNEQRHQDMRQLFTDIPEEFITDTKVDTTSIITTFLSN